jgi:hypothetical protein
VLTRSLVRLERLPGIAPGHSPWRGDILLLNHSRGIESAGASLRSGAIAISTKNKHLLLSFQIPTRGFTAAVSVFGGTPPPKPLKCKSLSDRLGARNRSVWTHHIGGTPRRSCASIRLALSDIIKTSFLIHSQFHYLSFCLNRCIFGQQKTLLTSP